MKNGICLTAAVFCLVLLQSSSTAAEAPTRRALLIGVSNYENLVALRGADNDVDLLRTVLTGKFGFLPQNVTVLKNQEATRANIVGAFEVLAGSVKPNDVVVIHFSGYGSQQVDVSGDEVQGYDATLVPYDGRGEPGGDVIDDELQVIIAQMMETTPNVTAIVDACFQVPYTRSGATVRCIERDDRIGYAQQKYEAKSREGLAIYAGSPPYALLLATRPGGVANEAVMSDRVYGALTFELARALMAAAPGDRFTTTVERVVEQVTARFPTQVPEFLFADEDAVLLFDDGFTGQWAGYVYFSGDDQVKLSGGSFHGLSAGTELDVYAPGTISFDRAKPIGKVQVSRANDVDATAQIVRGAAIPAGSVVRLPKVAAKKTGLSIWIDDAALDDAVQEQIAAELAGVPKIRLVDDEANAQLQVTALDDGFAVISGDLTILDSGLRDLRQLRRRIEDWIVWFEILELKNPTNELPVDLRVTRGDGSSLTTLRPGEIIEYRVVNTGSRPIYVHGIVLSSDGTVNQLPDLSVRIGPGRSIAGRLGTFLPEGREFVTDYLKIVVSAREAPVDDLLRGTEPPYRFQRSEWSTAQVSYLLKRQNARVRSFAVHVEEAGRSVPDDRDRNSRTICDEVGSLGCMIGEALDSEGTIVVFDRTFERSTVDDISPAEAFQEAYNLQRQLRVTRVEPLFEAAFGDDYTDIAGRSKSDDGHDPHAAGDKRWSVNYIRAPEAWEVVQARRGKPHGREAEGVRIAHLDTGYTRHPELYAGDTVTPEWGIDLVDGDGDPYDTLSTTGLLPNPGHGTASGSVIVSPADCQLEETETNVPCVTGVALGGTLVPVRVHTSVVVFNQKQMASAILAVVNGDVRGDPRVISIAMGGPPSWSLWKAVREAEKAGLLIVAAAGNNVGVVVWPARFRSTIAVGAINVLCGKWSGTSQGSRVDVSAPGESVWRAHVDKNTFVNGIGMSNGTTFATANTTGAAALWVALHTGSEAFDGLVESGAVTEAFRRAVTTSAWRPVTDDPGRPDTYCEENVGWDAKKNGAGILNVKALLDAPLDTTAERSAVSETLDDLPLFSSLYEFGTPISRVSADYIGIFPSPPDDAARFEAEIMYHYSMNGVVQQTIENMVSGANAPQDYARIRDALRLAEISPELREALSTP